MAFQDACIFGTGCLKIFIEDGEIKTERVMIEEIKIDDVESFYAKPRQIHQVKYVQKSVLKETFPGFDLQIDQATNTDDNSFQDYQSSTYKDMIKVVESWHLKSDQKQKMVNILFVFLVLLYLKNSMIKIISHLCFSDGVTDLLASLVKV